MLNILNLLNMLQGGAYGSIFSQNSLAIIQVHLSFCDFWFAQHECLGYGVYPYIVTF